MNIKDRMINYLNTWQLHRKTIKSLNMLSDTQLEDIGLTRGDIDDMIWLDEDKEKRGVKGVE